MKAEYALRNITKPIGVSEFTLIDSIPEELKTDLPTIEEIEQEFEQINNIEKGDNENE